MIIDGGHKRNQKTTYGSILIAPLGLLDAKFVSGNYSA